MRSCFRALERRRVRYLLVSGQAAVLYGASTFSEDVDLWVDATPANWQSLLTALADCGASFYKLTPPPTLVHARRGHGFHFTVRPDDSADPPGYLDVMGIVPRCAPFAVCRRRAEVMDTDWGSVPVIHRRDLALIKRTRRLADYDTISLLAGLEFERHHSRPTWRWAVANTFDAEARRALWDAAPAAWRRNVRAPALSAMAVARELERSRQADRVYWRSIIDDLKRLDREGRLVPEGTPVAEWLQAVKASQQRGTRA
jgi:hypothetical protein